METDWTKSIQSLYQKRARYYDITANLYYLVGFREWSYRQKAVQALELSPGDTVVELGCGTGLNFSLLQQQLGPSGTIVGVDLTDAMLRRARGRVRRNHWDNVRLVHEDMVDYSFPGRTDGILSTFALSIVRGTQLDSVVQKSCGALSSGGRMSVFDLRETANRWLRVLTPLFIEATRPFGVTRALAEERPWERIIQIMRKELTNVKVDEYYLGFAYLAAGTSV